MIAKNITYDQMMQALTALNTEYNDNIKFKRLERLKVQKYEGYMFTLGVNSSKKQGARYDYLHDRRIAAACWHVHGRFFDILLTIHSHCTIQSHIRGKLVIIYRVDNTIYNNWIDCNIGGYCNPQYYSQACRCNNDKEMLQEKTDFIYK